MPLILVILWQKVFKKLRQSQFVWKKWKRKKLCVCVCVCVIFTVSFCRRVHVHCHKRVTFVLSPQTWGFLEKHPTPSCLVRQPKRGAWFSFAIWVQSWVFGSSGELLVHRQKLVLQESYFFGSSPRLDRYFLVGHHGWFLGRATFFSIFPRCSTSRSCCSFQLCQKSQKSIDWCWHCRNSWGEFSNVAVNRHLFISHCMHAPITHEGHEFMKFQQNAAERSGEG